MKTCKACGEPKPKDAFYPHRTTKDRLSQACRVCTQNTARAYRAKNHERLRQKALQARAANRTGLAARARQDYAENREARKATQKAYRAKNSARLAEKNRAFRADNPEYFSAYERSRSSTKYLINLLHRLQNPQKWRAYMAEYARLRSAHLKQAQPPWADRKKIRDVYLACQMISEMSGVPHHVDHIVPLRGKTVCGLHIETNLQILTASDNLRKSNSYVG